MDPRAPLPPPPWYIRACLSRVRAPTRAPTHEHIFVWLPRGYASNGTYEHARTPLYPYLPRIQRDPLSYHLTRDHPLSFSSTSSKEANLLFIRGHRHAYVSNTKCVVCASQTPLCVRLHPGNQSNLLDTLKRARSSKAALYRWKIKYTSEGENAKNGTRWCLVKFDVPQKSYRYFFAALRRYL